MNIILALTSFLCIISINAAAATPNLSDRLNIPIKGQPYQLDTIISNNKIHLKMPEHFDQLEKYPSHIAENIKQRIIYRTRNVDTMSEFSNNIDAVISKHQLMQRTEYSRKLTEILLSIHYSTKNDKDPLFAHLPLLRRLPKYTKVNLIVPKRMRDEIWKEIQKNRMADRVTLHEVDTWYLKENGVELIHDTTQWAQDLLEMAYDENGTSYLLAPATRYQINDLSRSDNRYLKKLENSTRKVIYLPLFFRGGNILLGKSEKRILFIGEREFINNRSDYHNSLFVHPNHDEVISLYKKMTGADKIVTVKNSRNLFHIDMAMSFISDGRAALIKPIDENNLSADDSAAIQSIEAALIENGFKITYIPTTVDRINTFKSPVNIVIYEHLDNGNTEALVPLFDDVVIEKGSSLNDLIFETYHNAGINPIYIENRFHSAKGNLHCAISVLN